MARTLREQDSEPSLAEADLGNIPALGSKLTFQDIPVSFLPSNAEENSV
jgi:hypothetical protein